MELQRRGMSTDALRRSHSRGLWHAASTTCALRTHQTGMSPSHKCNCHALVLRPGLAISETGQPIGALHVIADP